MSKKAVDELLRTVRWPANRSPMDWPAIESAVGVHYCNPQPTTGRAGRMAGHRS